MELGEDLKNDIPVSYRRIEEELSICEYAHLGSISIGDETSRSIWDSLHLLINHRNMIQVAIKKEIGLNPGSYIQRIRYAIWKR